MSKRSLICVLALALAACSKLPLLASAPTAAGPRGALSLFQAQLTLKLATTRRAQMLPATGAWSQATVTVNSSKLLSPLSQSFPGSVSTLAANFALPPGTASISVKLYNGSTLVSQGSLVRDLVPGPNAVTITMTPTATTVGTWAGNGYADFSGDQGPAGAAVMSDAQAVCTDSVGNLYVADTSNNRVRMVPKVAGTYFGQSMTAGNLYTIAGPGTAGYLGDGGSATSAQINQPHGLAVDSGGNLYIADYGNQRVRKVSPSGVISTYAGNGTAGNSGDGGPATSANLNYPYGLTVDATGDLYISDSGNNRIRMVNTGGTISAFAGTGTAGYAGNGGTATSAQLNQPYGLAMDASGTLYIADHNNQRVRRVTTSGIIDTFAGTGTAGSAGDGGAATSANLAYPCGIAVDATGDVFIADSSNQRVREVSVPTSIISTVAGGSSPGNSGDGGSATSAQLFTPTGVALDGSTIYISDSTNHNVRRVSGGTITTYLGGGSIDGSANTAEFAQPEGIACDGSGNLYVADSKHHRIRMINPSGQVTTVAGSGVLGFAGDGLAATAARFQYPFAIALDAANDLFIADYDNGRIRMVPKSAGTYFGQAMNASAVYTIAGNGGTTFSGDNGVATSASLSYPRCVVVDASGDLIIADTGNHRIRMVPQTSGTYYNVSMTANNIYTIAGNGTAGSAGDGGAATSAMLNAPHAVTIDASGRLYIADTSNNAIREVTPAGVISTVCTGLSSPNGVFAAPSGAVYVADTSDHRVVQINTTATASPNLLAGTTTGYTDGLGTSAQFYFPVGLAIAPDGKLFVSDDTDNRIRYMVVGP